MKQKLQVFSTLDLVFINKSLHTCTHMKHNTVETELQFYAFIVPT